MKTRGKRPGPASPKGVVTRTGTTPDAAVGMVHTMDVLVKLRRGQARPARVTRGALGWARAGGSAGTAPPASRKKRAPVTVSSVPGTPRLGLTLATAGLSSARRYDSGAALPSWQTYLSREGRDRCH